MELFVSPIQITHTEKFSAELAFTETYKAHRDDPPAIREACCLRAGSGDLQTHPPG